MLELGSFFAIHSNVFRAMAGFLATHPRTPRSESIIKVRRVSGLVDGLPAAAIRNTGLLLAASRFSLTTLVKECLGETNFKGLPGGPGRGLEEIKLMQLM